MGKRAPAPLRRRGPVRAEKHIFAIFSEGEATEPEYFRALAKLPEFRKHARLELRINLTGAVPLTLVRQAVAAKNGDEASEYWCVFDVEWPKHHPNLEEAISLASKHEIDLAVSNPCFEVWLILHLKEHSGFLDNDGARRLRRSLDGKTDKHLDPIDYTALRALATKRAITLDSKHEKDGTSFPNNNPSSTAYKLVQAIERAGERLS